MWKYERFICEWYHAWDVDRVDLGFTNYNSINLISEANT